MPVAKFLLISCPLILPSSHPCCAALCSCTRRSKSNVKPALLAGEDRAILSCRWAATACTHFIHVHWHSCLPLHLCLCKVLAVACHLSSACCRLLHDLLLPLHVQPSAIATFHLLPDGNESSCKPKASIFPSTIHTSYSYNSLEGRCNKTYHLT